VHQIVSSGTFRASFESLTAFVHLRLREHKDRIGFNLAGLRYHDRVFADAALPSDGSAVSLVEPRKFKLGKRKDVTIF
jgi:hypothetical protein